MNSFKDNVINIVKNIPKGKVLTYSEVAHKAGNIKAARVVGNILSKNTNKDIPCHRVIKADMNIGSYNGILGKSKLDILKKEKVLFDNQDKVIKLS